MKTYYFLGAAVFVLMALGFAFTYMNHNDTVPAESRSVAEGLPVSDLFGTGNATTTSSVQGMDKVREAEKMAISGGVIE